MSDFFQHTIRALRTRLSPLRHGKDEPGFLSSTNWTIATHASLPCNRLDLRHQLEASLCALDIEDLWTGYCTLCRMNTRFELPSKISGTPPNLREELVCAGCGLNARMRAGLQLVVDSAPAPSARIYLTEQASKAFAWLQKRYRHTHGSEFTTDPVRVQQLEHYLEQHLGGNGPIQFEDVTHLTFRSGSLDVVVSFDVLEHVPDFHAALKEFARVLRPGGRLILTAPFVENANTTIVRAKIVSTGGIEHLLEPEYHGDPVLGGILCFYHFGWDLLDHARSAGFSRAEMRQPWAPSLGYCGGLWTLVAER